MVRRNTVRLDDLPPVFSSSALGRICLCARFGDPTVSAKTVPASRRIAGHLGCSFDRAGLLLAFPDHAGGKLEATKRSESHRTHSSFSAGEHWVAVSAGFNHRPAASALVF